MPESSRPPLSRRLQARAFRIINVPMRAVLGLPVATPLGRSLMLAFIVGRKSGKTYRQPLSYVRDGDALLTPGGGNWKRNLKTGVPVRIRLRGKDLTATPEIVSDVDDIGKLLVVMAAGNPRSASFIGIPRDPDGQFDRDGLETAVHYGFRIVRWHPVTS
ncbi:MAG TPA: nitroreductase/quinone reductase family protein [Streptosporangiaceae bacterium]|nr:nitroreductase/quinone reductase family protein [Streptosporangiaceae bacterium]